MFPRFIIEGKEMVEQMVQDLAGNEESSPGPQYDFRKIPGSCMVLARTRRLGRFRNPCKGAWSSWKR